MAFLASLGLALLCTIINAASLISDESAEAAGQRMFQEFMNKYGKVV